MSNSCPYSFVSFCLVCSLEHFLHYQSTSMRGPLSSPCHVLPEAFFSIFSACGWNSSPITSGLRIDLAFVQLFTASSACPLTVFACSRTQLHSMLCCFHFSVHKVHFSFGFALSSLHSRANSSFFSQFRPHAAAGVLRSGTAPGTSLAIWTHSAYQVVPSHVRLSQSLMYRVAFHSNPLSSLASSLFYCSSRTSCKGNCSCGRTPFHAMCLSIDVLSRKNQIFFCPRIELFTGVPLIHQTVKKPAHPSYCLSEQNIPKVTCTVFLLGRSALT